jgi:hypothetical protein
MPIITNICACPLFPGPDATPNSAGRGVGFMRGQFVQTAVMTFYEGTYMPADFPLDSEMQGNSYLDSWDRGPPPFYGAPQDIGNPIFRGDQGSVATIWSWDTPGGSVLPTTWNGSNLSDIHLQWDYYDYVVAYSMDRGAGFIPTPTSEAVGHWQFNWSSGVDPAHLFVCTNIVKHDDEMITDWTPVPGGEPPDIHDDPQDYAFPTYNRFEFHQGD